MKKTSRVMTSFYNRNLLFGLIITGVTNLAPGTYATTSWIAGNTGLWGSGANWNNGVPGSPDNTARMNDGGTANVTVGTPAINSGSVDFRMNDSNNASVNTVNWNPSANYIFNVLWVGNNVAGAAEFTHDSGTIRADNNWYHIGRRGTATYTMSGIAKIQADDRVSIGEGAGGSTDAYLIMSGASSIDGDHANASNNDYFIAHNTDARGTLMMSENTFAAVPRWEVGRQNNAIGTIIMNDNAAMETEFESEFGMYDNAQAHVTMNSGAQWRSDGAFGLSQQNDRNSETTFTQNGNSFVRVNSWFEMGGGQATYTMNGTSDLDANANLIVGMRNATSISADPNATGADGISRMIINDNATVRGEGGIVGIGNNSGSQGLIELNTSGRLFADFVAVGLGGAGTLNINNNAEVTTTGWFVSGQNVNGDGRGGTVNLTGGLLSVGSDFNLGERQTSTLNMSGGELYVGNNFYLARDHQGQTDSTATIVNQSGGTVTVNNFLHLEQFSSGGGEGTYNLTGGTLRVNDLRMGNGAAQGVFNWAGGTLSMEEPGVGQSGIGGGGFGGAGVGTTINVNANGGTLATGVGAVLDLGDLYQNNGIGFDVLAVTGNLDLTAAGDVLDFWDNVNLIRPGGNTTTTGEYQLISVTGTISGQFDSVIGPSELGQFFQFYQTGPTAIPLGTSADALRRNTGYIDYRADGAYFVYKVGGSIPEPQTTAFLFLGVALLRGFTIMQRNNALRNRKTQV